MIALEVVPVVAVSAVRHRLAGGNIFVNFQHVLDHAYDPMGAATTPPSQVFHCVKSASESSMASTLHCVASNTTDRRQSVAFTHVDGVCSVTEVMASSICSLLMGA